VLFRAVDPLTDGIDGGAIYRYRVSSGELERLTGDPGPDGLGATSAVASDDASTVAFVSTAALGGAAVAGEPNAYVWRGGALRFVAALSGGGTIDRVSRDGTYVVLSTTASLGSASSGGFKTLYRYTTTTRDLDCVSCRTNGTANAGDSAVDMFQGSYFAAYSDPRAVTDDGRVFFASRDRLVAADPAETPDAYEFTDKGLRLLSNGRGSTYVMDNTNDGTSVFMSSTGALTTDDTDAGDFDLYVSRVGGGFAPPRAAPTCDGDACQPTTRTPDVPSGPGSTAAGPGNPTTPPTRVRSAKLVAAPSVAASGRHAFEARGRGTVRVRIRGAGRLTVTARARLTGKTRTLGRASRTITGAGTRTATLTLRLNAAARRELRRTKRLRVRLDAQFPTAQQHRFSTITLKGSAR
jgi:hypothetical protein